MISFPAGIIRVLVDNPQPAVLSFRLKNVGQLDSILVNKQLVHESVATPYLTRSPTSSSYTSQLPPPVSIACQQAAHTPDSYHPVSHSLVNKQLVLKSVATTRLTHSLTSSSYTSRLFPLVCTLYVCFTAGRSAGEEGSDEGRLYSFVMPALTEHLRRQAEHTKSASYFNIDILKYQVRPFCDVLS